MIRYTNSLKNITAEQLTGGFFNEWGNKFPSPQKHLEILHNSYAVVLAVDESTNQVIGFINAISDNILCVYIPLLEVLEEYQNKGIGTELVDRMMKELNSFYMIDLLCDKKLQPYYEKRGMTRAGGMCVRNFHLADGEHGND
ncbi:GNAT family N-acetyltransferase [Evansella halocellulosilytica]|uniref:GNAT family N-acetyltransferase n=1 Tax=Evansella halocellulosilytica TaxID=2011013 RepID=UPI0027B97CA0|nr:GNAT family N-acetyltransferase [Evansella halocellulosilytica]